MRKGLILLVIIYMMAMVGASVSLAQDEEMEAWACPEGYEGQTLRVFNWSTYVAEDTIPNFEEACGVTVEYFEYGSNEEMLNVIRAESAQYDIVVPSGDTVARMINEELLQPLNLDMIPNFENLLDAFKNPAYDPDNGYSIAYQWGTVGIGYDVNFVEEGFESWADFFAYEGRVAWLDDQRATIGVALLLMGEDPNTTDEEKIAAAGQFLLDNTQSQVLEIAPDTGQDLLVRGEVDAVVEYSGDIFQIMDECECEDFAYVIPSEGTNVWTDNMAIPFNAANPELAHVFIDYILDAQVGADLSNYTAYGSPNGASIPLIDEELTSDPGIYPSDETLDSSFIAIEVGEAEQYYSEAWNNINAAIGN